MLIGLRTTGPSRIRPLRPLLWASKRQTIVKSYSDIFQHISITIDKKVKGIGLSSLQFIEQDILSFTEKKNCNSVSQETRCYFKRN